MKFQARTDKNRKIEARWDLINEYAKRWKPNTFLDIEITRRKSKVSDPLRKYYFSTVLPPFMNELGYEPPDQMNFHRQLKIVYYNVKPDERGIYRESDVPSVFSNESDIPVDKKVEFVEWVKRTAARYGVYIPDPGE